MCEEGEQWQACTNGPFLLPRLDLPFCTEVGMPGRAEPLGRSFLEIVFVKLDNRQNIITIIIKQYSESTVLSELLIKKRVRRAAPAAQRRLAGKPKAKPGTSLPRSEIRQFPPASRFIFLRGVKEKS